VAQNVEGDERESLGRAPGGRGELSLWELL